MTPPYFILRPATSEQVDLVYDLMMASFEEYRGRIIPLPTALGETRDDNRQAMARGGALIAWVGGAPAGSARYELESDHLYMGRLSVLPAHRGHGIGQALTLAMEPITRSHGYHTIRLGTRLSMPSNMRMYQALGYTIIRHDPYPDSDDVRAIFEKQLD